MATLRGVYVWVRFGTLTPPFLVGVCGACFAVGFHLYTNYPCWSLLRVFGHGFCLNPAFRGQGLWRVRWVRAFA